MAQDLSQRVTYVWISDLKKEGIPFEKIDVYKKPVVNVPRGKPHAIVRDNKTLDNIGIVFYEKPNGLPYSIFEHTVEYVFLRPYNITRTTKPRPLIFKNQKKKN